MRQKFEGNQYRFLIQLDNIGEEYFFEILSIFKHGNHKSTITNVNFILSEVVEPILNPDDSEDYESDYPDTTLEVNKHQGEAMFALAVENFNDKTWIKWLEKELDEDKSQGGWNSSFEF